ncbi:MAG: nicotinate-nucleotide--dimethylbenzimidazole phosphoribosyltransferase [Oscillospiraceae bacterium]|nr:nicotinate-nucleotide--dimethylbenzimidazole phosphoribosyltransferase [Oscillospiraceae bacterium]
MIDIPLIRFDDLNKQIPAPSEEARAASKAHWDGIAKPLNGLGDFEEIVTRIAALTGSEDVCIDKRIVLVLCADNGVVAEGVTQTDASVTATMAGEIARHRSSVCRMAAAAHADVVPIDIGINRRVSDVRDCHIADGTGNIAVGPAMTKEQAYLAILTGIDLVRECRAMGYQLIATGEMGIGNTTTSSAVASVLLGLPVETVTGRGAGLSDEGLQRKISAIRRAIEVNRPECGDALDVLAKLGGFDIAGMTGIFLGGALCGVPVVIDGLISSVAALIAARLCPASKAAMIASHCSAEPAAQQILQELGLKAVLNAGLKLGEGTGAVCMMPLLDLVLSVYHNSASFTDTGVEQYVPQESDKR